MTRWPLRCGCGKRNPIVFPRAVGATIFFMRSICFSLLWACEALLALARKRSTNSCNAVDLALLILVVAICCSSRDAFCST